MLRFKYFKHIGKKQEGFTLVEVLTVLVIIIAMSVVILTNFPELSSRQSLDLATQDLALSVREMQFYGVTGVESSDLGIQDFNYGVYYDGTDVKFYSDIDDNGIYSAGTDIVVNLFQEVQGKYEILKVLCNPSGDSNDDGKCLPDLVETPAQSANMLFKRVTIEPFLTGKNGSGINFTSTPIVYFKFFLTNTSGDQVVTVWNSGQITIEETP